MCIMASMWTLLITILHDKNVEVQWNQEHNPTCRLDMNVLNESYPLLQCPSRDLLTSQGSYIHIFMSDYKLTPPFAKTNAITLLQPPSSKTKRFHMKLRNFVILFSCQNKKSVCRKIGMRNMHIIEIMVSQNGQLTHFSNLFAPNSCNCCAASLDESPPRDVLSFLKMYSRGRISRMRNDILHCCNWMNLQRIGGVGLLYCCTWCAY
jgi:hypothetical protein